MPGHSSRGNLPVNCLSQGFFLTHLHVKVFREVFLVFLQSFELDQEPLLCGFFERLYVILGSNKTLEAFNSTTGQP